MPCQFSCHGFAGNQWHAFAYRFIQQITPGKDMRRTAGIFLVLVHIIIHTPLCAQQKKEKGPSKPGDSTALRLEYSLQAITSRLDNMHLTLNRITDFSGLGFNTSKVEAQLPGIRDNLQTISENLSQTKPLPEFKSLQLFGVLLKDIQLRLEGWRNALFKYNGDLININAEMNAFNRDSIIRQLVKDSQYRKMYIDELTVLETKWKQADTFTSAHLSKINSLQYSISHLYFQTIDLENQVGLLKKDLAAKIFNKE